MTDDVSREGGNEPTQPAELQPPIANDIRTLAIAALVLYGVSAALAGLTYAFPYCALPQENTALFCLPPQAYVGILTIPLMLIAATLAGVLSLVASLLHQRWGWAPLFAALPAIAVFGPIIFVMAYHKRESVSLSDEQVRALLIISGVALLLLPLLALRFAGALMNAARARAG